MKIRTAILVLIGLLCGTGVAADQPDLAVGFSDDVAFPATGTADGFRLEGVIYCTDGITPVLEDTDVIGESGTGNWTCDSTQLVYLGSENWWFRIDFVTDGEIGSYEDLHVGVDLTAGGYSGIADLCRHWMEDGTPLSPEVTAITESFFDPNGLLHSDEQTLRIANDSPGGVSVLAFQLAVSTERIPLSDLSETGLGHPGESSPSYPDLEWETVTDFPDVLPTDAYFDVILEDYDVEVSPGEYLLFRGQQTQAASRRGGIYFWAQHRANPDPTGIETADGSGDAAPASCLRIENRPNPFNPATTIRFRIPEAGRAVLSVHDLAGRRVATLVNDSFEAGSFTATWDGRDEAGREAGSGIYFARLRTGGFTAMRKMVLIR